jgi:hypothetical protein
VKSAGRAGPIDEDFDGQIEAETNVVSGQILGVGAYNGAARILSGGETTGRCLTPRPHRPVAIPRAARQVAEVRLISRLTFSRSVPITEEACHATLQRSTHQDSLTELLALHAPSSLDQNAIQT